MRRGQRPAVESCLDMSNDWLAGNAIALRKSSNPPRLNEPWIFCPSRQSITPVVRLLRDTFKEKTTGILSQLIEHGVLDTSVLTESLPLSACGRPIDNRSLRLRPRVRFPTATPRSTLANIGKHRKRKNHPGTRLAVCPDVEKISLQGA